MFGGSAGQTKVLPKAIEALSAQPSELPVFVLFTQHWDQSERVEMFCDLMNRYPNDQHRVTGLNKNDTSGMMLLIQRVVTVKKMVEERRALLQENKRLQKKLAQAYLRPKNIIGESPPMLKVYREVEVLAPGNSTILILGEHGTGKDLVAQAIHNQSPRKGELFVRINCAAIPEHLIESELFGYEQGAFTGADRQQIGKFEHAKGGTIFLDEIGELSLPLQAKLLTVLQEKEFNRVGGNNTVEVKARFIAATNKNLEQMIRENTFREDLFYRLTICPITLPPLRHRRDDISTLVEHFVKKKAGENKKKIPTVSNDAMSSLSSYSWPGNIRELENCIERAVQFCDASDILPEHLQLKETLFSSVRSNDASLYPSHLSNIEKVGKAIAYLEVCEGVAEEHGKITQQLLADKWGCTRANVTSKLGRVKEEMSQILNYSPNLMRWQKVRASGFVKNNKSDIKNFQPGKGVPAVDY
ncbi:MAG: sigma-54-dependent Fis family transcriptional regulator [Candidatus Electrothrix sp. ATG2]|nr:sigma-54-dependent Fis family transcriptional regulator [Candidatus Electrothrix sp. ATG2]